ncbi:MAG: twin-arginine translocation signal domain-containing protein [Gammaproteobacteria bacterium]|nr:twin-arginine translocation signal domain-containing protein [Gammaproteobacteria bacterium]
MSQSKSFSRRNFVKSAAIVGGAATLGACASSPQSASPGVVTQNSTPSFFPKHNDRTKGWLNLIWQKATFPDDWGYHENIEKPWGINNPRGDIDWSVKDGRPHPWWDQYTAPPMLSYPRFDLTDSSYPIMLMADQTPAWREVYTRIMDEMATRHTAYQAAIDWNTFIGPSPDRDNYGPLNAPGFPLWPERVRGNYDAPGWTANGVEPWGLQPDPIGADGNLFFRGWLNLILSIYKYVSGDDKWEQPWQIAGYENEQFEWTQPRIVEHLHRQYTAHPEGPHCENTKIWPACNSAAGLGIYLSDQLGVTNSHGVFENWIEFMKDNYMGINDQNQIEWMTIYYDPLEEFKVNIPGAGAGAGIAFYLLPQSPELATQIYDALANASGWRDPNREIRPNAAGQVMAKALGDHTVVDRLNAAAEQFSEPKWFGEDMEKFGWWFNYGEPWPRGQGTAQQMISEIAEGNWIDSFKVKHLDKYTAPTLEGVDFPNLGVDTAWNDKASGVLNIGTYVGHQGERGRPTSWQITNLPNAAEAIVICDGTTVTNIEILNRNTIRVPADIGQHQYQIYTGYFGQEVALAKPDPMHVASASSIAATKRTAEQNVRAAETVMASGSANCPCCAGVT